MSHSSNISIELQLASYFNSRLSLDQVVQIFSDEPARNLLFKTKLIFIFTGSDQFESNEFVENSKLAQSKWYQDNLASFKGELKQKMSDLEASKASLVASNINKSLCALAELHELYGDYKKAIDYLNESQEYDAAAPRAVPGSLQSCYEISLWKECQIMRLNYLLGNWRAMQATMSGKEMRQLDDESDILHSKRLIYASIAAFRQCLSSTFAGSITKGNDIRAKEWQRCLELFWKCINTPEFLPSLAQEPVSPLEFSLCPIIACIISQSLTEPEGTISQTGIIKEFSLELFRMNSVFEQVLNKVTPALLTVLQDYLNGNLFVASENLFQILSTLQGLHRGLFGWESDGNGRDLYSVLKLATFAMYANAFISFSIDSCNSFQHFNTFSTDFISCLNKERWVGEDDYITIENGVCERRKKDQTIQVSLVELDKSIGELQIGPAIVAALSAE